ncbi:NUDIX hydrolase [Bacillus cereus]|uniref:NUDIX hydrolase n=1 Tax=Bacillus cereus TaxID=1396 RepID=A0A9X8IW76_BACCE|nr:NUDIX hydrolase [Bacillus cereus]RWQ71098.1 NUDIX hydrolase [Bacillus cereus]
MIRKAVGAIISYNEKFMLVHKIKINGKSGKEEIEGEWDFPKGGIENEEKNLEQSLLRELKEETGSTNYKIIKQFEKKICFEFPVSIQMRIGYEKQETIMFFVQYQGDIEELKPIDDEIDQIQFFGEEQVLEKLAHVNTRRFFEEYCINKV